MEMGLRPKLEQDLEASCKYPGVSHAEIQGELNTESTCDSAVTNRTRAWTVLLHSLPLQRVTNSFLGCV